MTTMSKTSTNKTTAKKEANSKVTNGFILNLYEKYNNPIKVIIEIIIFNDHF